MKTIKIGNVNDVICYAVSDLTMDGDVILYAVGDDPLGADYCIMYDSGVYPMTSDDVDRWVARTATAIVRRG